MFPVRDQWMQQIQILGKRIKTPLTTHNIAPTKMSSHSWRQYVFFQWASHLIAWTLVILDATLGLLKPGEQMGWNAKDVHLDTAIKLAFGNRLSPATNSLLLIPQISLILFLYLQYDSFKRYECFARTLRSCFLCLDLRGLRGWGGRGQLGVRREGNCLLGQGVSRNIHPLTYGDYSSFIFVKSQNVNKCTHKSVLTVGLERLISDGREASSLAHSSQIGTRYLTSLKDYVGLKRVLFLMPLW